MAHNYRIVISPLSKDDCGGFIGKVPDLPGCMSDGETQEEALKNTQEAIDEWLEENRRLGRAAPKPGASAKRGQEAAFIP